MNTILSSIYVVPTHEILPFSQIKSSKANFDFLPGTTLTKVFSLLTDRQLFNVIKVSQHWRSAAAANGAWEGAFKLSFPRTNLPSSNTARRHYFMQKVSGYYLFKNKLKTKTEIAIPTLHRFFFRSFVHNSHYFIGGSPFGTVFILNRDNGSIQHFGFHMGCVDYLSIWKSFLITASTYSKHSAQSEDRIVIFDLKNNKPLLQIDPVNLTKGGRNPILNCNGKLAIVDGQITLLIYDIAQNQLQSFYMGPQPITCLTNWKNKQVVVGHSNGLIQTVDLISHEILQKIQNDSAIVDLAITNCEKLVICDTNKYIKVFNLINKCDLLYSLHHLGQDVHFARVQSIGNRIISILYNIETPHLFIETWLVNNPHSKDITRFKINNFFKHNLKDVRKFEIIPSFDHFIIQGHSPFIVNEEESYEDEPLEDDMANINLNLSSPILIAPSIRKSRILSPQIIDYNETNHSLASYHCIESEIDFREEINTAVLHDPIRNNRFLERSKTRFHRKKLEKTILLIVHIGVVVIAILAKVFDTSR